MRGGSRPGAGRKKGSATKKTREIANKAAATGITPLEVMLLTMRREWRKYTRDKSPESAQAALSAAQLAAPYMHPRLASVEQFVDAKVRNFAVSSEPLKEDEWERTYGPLAAPGGASKGAH